MKTDPVDLPVAFDVRSQVATLAKLGALVICYVLIDRALNWLCHVPEEAYAKPVLLLEVARRLGILGLGATAIGAAVLIRFGGLLTTWDEFEQGRRLRRFVVFLAMVVAWPLATLGYNHYFDQFYLLDRLLLILMLIGLWYRPLFVFPFLALATAIMYQLVQPPLGGSVLAHKQQVLHVLTAFAATVLMRPVSGRNSGRDFVFLVCCVVAGAYWEAALAKLEIGWITYGHLYQALFSAQAHGWLAAVGADRLATFGALLSSIDWPMRVFVLTVEAGCLFFLWRRSLAIALLVALMVFHLGVFAIFGFLFWTWMLVDLALLALLLSQRRSLFVGIHGRTLFLASLVLIGTAGVWSRPPHLGWLDTRLSYTLRYKAVGVSGAEYPLSPRFFEPYGDTFTMATFPYLIRDHTRLTGAYGVTKDRRLADRLAAPLSAEDIFALEQERGAPPFRATQADRWIHFVRVYLRNRNEGGDRYPWLTRLGPPPQFWSSVKGEGYSGQEPVRELVVTEHTRLLRDGRSEPIRELEVMRIEITPNTAGAR